MIPRGPGRGWAGSSDRRCARTRCVVEARPHPGGESSRTCCMQECVCQQSLAHRRESGSPTRVPRPRSGCPSPETSRARRSFRTGGKCPQVTQLSSRPRTRSRPLPNARQRPFWRIVGCICGCIQGSELARQPAAQRLPATCISPGQHGASPVRTPKTPREPNRVQPSRNNP